MVKDVIKIDRMVGKRVSEEIFKNCIETIAKNCKHYSYRPYPAGHVKLKINDIAIVTIVASCSDKATDALREIILGEESGFIQLNIVKELLTNNSQNTLNNISTLIRIIQELTNMKCYALIELEAKNRIPLFIVIDENDGAYMAVANSTADLAKELADIDFKTYNYPEGNPCISKRFDYNEIIDAYYKVADIIKTYEVRL